MTSSRMTTSIYIATQIRVKSLEDYKKHREPQDHEESRKPRNPGSPQESGKSTRVKEDCQVSRIQNRSLEDWQTSRVKIPENNS